MAGKVTGKSHYSLYLGAIHNSCGGTRKSVIDPLKEQPVNQQGFARMSLGYSFSVCHPATATW